MTAHHRWWTGTVALVLAVWLAGPSSHRLWAAELDPFLPADTENVLMVNLRQIFDSPLVKKYALGPAQDALSGLADVNDVLKDLGFDPFKDLDRILFATPGGKEKDRGLIIVHGKFDLAKFKARGEDAAKDNADILKIHKVPLGGGAQHIVYEVIPPGEDMSLFVALPDKNTLLISGGKDYVVDALKNTRAKKKAVLKNKDVQALLEKMDLKQSIAVVGLGKSLTKGGALDDAPAAVKDALEKIEAIAGGITIDKGVKLEMVVAATTAKDARSLKESADKSLKVALAALAVISGDNKGLAALLEVAKTIKVSNKGKVLTIKAEVSGEVIEEALKKDD
jgi:hypothetical protein